MSHAHGGRHHRHTHTLDPAVLRSRAGVRAVLVSLGVLGATAVLQAVVFVLSGSVALLADLIHNAGDALTAIPVGAAFLLRSVRAERWAGYAVVAVIFVSACVALYESVARLLSPQELEHLWALAGAGAVGYAGNEVAARVRLRAGRRLESPALIADGNHARVDAFVSLGVVASAAVVALGLDVADPLIGLAITLVILRITWDSWRVVRSGSSSAPGHVMHDARRYDLQMWARTLGRERRFRDGLVELARVREGEVVLDVGCGTGSLALAAKRRVGPVGVVHAIDASPEMVARARRKAARARLNVRVEVRTAQELPLADGSVDAVLATLVLHHLPGDDLVRALREVRRVLAPGGRFLAVELDLDHPENPRGSPHAHAHGAGAHFDLADVAKLAADAGLEVVETGPLPFRLLRFERMRYLLATAS